MIGPASYDLRLGEISIIDGETYKVVDKIDVPTIVQEWGGKINLDKKKDIFSV